MLIDNEARLTHYYFCTSHSRAMMILLNDDDALN